VHQVHGNTCVDAASCAGREPRVQADAITVHDLQHAATIRTADCVPVLLARADGLAVAAVHAGWRGVVAGAVPRAVKSLGTGSSILAAIGPCMGPEAFEIGPEVAAAFAAAGLGAAVQHGHARPHADLTLAVRWQLLAAGITAIDAWGGCTYAQERLFHSHRRDTSHRGLPSGRLACCIARPAPQRPAKA
jgi:hypothetical protein